MKLLSNASLRNAQIMAEVLTQIKSNDIEWEI